LGNKEHRITQLENVSIHLAQYIACIYGLGAKDKGQND